MLTEIRPEQAAYVIRMAGMIRSTAPELSRSTVLVAATRAGIYPQTLPGEHFADVDLDLRSLGDPQSAENFVAHASLIDTLVSRVQDGVRRGDTKKVAVFAIARIPLLIHLGARLDDKVPSTIFNRHRTDEENAWIWPSNEKEPSLSLQTVRRQQGTNPQNIALVVSLSGTVRQDELPPAIDATYSVYEITPGAGVIPSPSLMRSRSDLGLFEQESRRFLAMVEQEHGKIDTIALFPALNVAPAVVLGRVLMPNVSPSWRVFDRDAYGVFFDALEVKR